MWPASDSDADVGATKLFDGLWNGLFIEPMLLGRYPEDALPLVEDAIVDGDMTTIRQPLDFYGVNYYEPQGVAAPGEGNPLPFELRVVEGYPMTTNDSPIVPDGLRELLVSFHERYPDLPPVYVTENGCSFADTVAPDGGVHDQDRIDFLAGHLGALRAAIDAGVDVRGYFVWSLLDNFEWSKGYAPRFGLVHVDYETQRRTPKDSFEWYRKLVTLD
jgi:beta-glucosidase